MSRSRSQLAVPLTLLVVLTSGCKSDKKPDALVDAGATAATAPAVTSGETVAPEPSVPALMDLPSRFAYEASHRPTGIVTAEQVFDAFTAQGEALTERKQHMAHPFGAKYCQGAKAPKEQHLFSVCEYASEKEAEAGVPLAEKFGKEQRSVIRNGSSVLIARYEGKVDTSKAEAIFRSLKPAAKP